MNDRNDQRERMDGESKRLLCVIILWCVVVVRCHRLLNAKLIFFSLHFTVSLWPVHWLALPSLRLNFLFVWFSPGSNMLLKFTFVQPQIQLQIHLLSLNYNFFCHSLCCCMCCVCKIKISCSSLLPHAYSCCLNVPKCSGDFTQYHTHKHSFTRSHSYTHFERNYRQQLQHLKRHAKEMTLYRCCRCSFLRSVCLIHVKMAQEHSQLCQLRTHEIRF